MHATPDLRVFSKWTIIGSGSVITDVIHLKTMETSFGKNPIRPKPRAWASAMGFSWAEWIDDDGHISIKSRG